MWYETNFDRHFSILRINPKKSNFPCIWAEKQTFGQEDGIFCHFFPGKRTTQACFWLWVLPCCSFCFNFGSVGVTGRSSLRPANTNTVTIFVFAKTCLIASVFTLFFGWTSRIPPLPQLINPESRPPAFIIVYNSLCPWTIHSAMFSVIYSVPTLVRSVTFAEIISLAAICK